MVTLDKIDIITERTGVSYAEAKEILEKFDGDVVETLIYFGEKSKIKSQKTDMYKENLISQEKKDQIIKVAIGTTKFVGKVALGSALIALKICSAGMSSKERDVCSETIHDSSGR